MGFSPSRINSVGCLGNNVFKILASACPCPRKSFSLIEKLHEISHALLSRLKDRALHESIFQIYINFVDWPMIFFKKYCFLFVRCRIGSWTQRSEPLRKYLLCPRDSWFLYFSVHMCGMRSYSGNLSGETCKMLQIAF